MKTHFQIVSPPMPTGVTWLINVLLELGIRTTPYGGDWVEGPQGSTLTPPELLENQLWHLPAMHRHRAFAFDPGLEGFWDHRLSFAQYPTRKTILFVRDLRDTVYSHLCRQLNLTQAGQGSQELLERLPQPEIWQQYFPPLFDLPAADTLAYFYGCWLHRLAPEHLLVLRFEDSKRDPQAEVHRVLRFLGIQRPETAITTALAHSELSWFHRIKQHMEQQTGIHKVINRKGEINEWRKTLSGQDQTAFLTCFSGPPAWAQHTLSYPDAPEMPEAQSLALQQEVQQQLQRNAFAQTWHWLQGQIQTADALFRPALTNQWLALLWTRAILGPAQLGLPSACALASQLAALNARFRHHPALQAAVQRSLDPQHALHQVKPESVWQADTTRPLAEAVLQAQSAGEAFLLWQSPEIRLTSPGLLQLMDLLDGRIPGLLAALPTLATTEHADSGQQAWQAHAQWGAEFRRIQLHELPACILFRTEALMAMPLEQPESIWLPGQNIQLAMGVIAWKNPDKSNQHESNQPG